MAFDTEAKKYIKQIITELERSWEKRTKERDRKADQRLLKHLEAMEKRGDQRIEASLKRHIGALTEDFKSQVSGIAEQYGSIKKTLDEHTHMLAAHTEMIGGLMVNATETKDTLNVVQSDIEIIKNDLKQEIDRSEFEALVKRVSFVEKKLISK